MNAQRKQADASAQIREGEQLAAADIGSNSFHLIVARYEHGEPRVIDRLRENVRLAAGLKSDGSLDDAHRDKALACLARFGQRLRGMPPTHIRAVATNAVRQLRAAESFLAPAEFALGCPIEVVSGREEARLIYLGVAHGIPDTPGKRLVVDIGGGSTEFIIGERLEPLKKESLQVGCVASTLRFFGDGKLTPRRWQQAQTDIAVELQQFAADYRAFGWDEAIGSSGTVRAIDAVLREAGWSDGGITRGGLDRLRDAVISCGNVENVNFPGLSEDRAGIFAGGVAILEAAFAALGIERMRVAETSMREGLLYDMIGRAEHRDPRSASIDALAQRYAVDRTHAARVEACALALFDQVAAAWQLGQTERDWLGWSARIHEIGLAIAHSQYHKHGAYIAGHSDLAGFARHEQQVLAVLLRCQRRKPDVAAVRALPERLRLPAAHIIALLRLAVLLQRSREPAASSPATLRADGQTLQLALPRAWLDAHPLTGADLEQERAYLKSLDIKLHIAAA
ncbi:MAG TPA: exopolyphosphatase [Rudaea sp.]|jgi:exopolyphosphatase/guanosine-5'-triphosphate,3'-diphosphate pyrophosphatase